MSNPAGNGHADDESERNIEEARLREFQKYLEQNQKPIWEGSFDRLVQLAAQICDVPKSHISLVGKEVNYHQATLGFEAEITPKDKSICQHTVSRGEYLEIGDTLNNSLTQNNDFVTDEFGLRFYAGAPLKCPKGYSVGTICVLDHKPRNLRESQKRALKTLADEVVAHFELQSARDDLEKLNQEKDELIRIVSHDMRNPLTGIIGFSELLQEEVDDEMHREMLQQIEDSGLSMMGIINVLLSSEYIQNEAFAIYRKHVDLYELTYEVVKLHRPFKLLKKQSLQVEIDQPLECNIDPEKWKQIVGNLLNNAIKFTGEGGSIKLRVRKLNESQSAVELIVIDNGIGMDSQLKKRLFSGSKSILRPGTEGESSSGVGMQLVKKYIDLHSGEVEVYSEEAAGTEVCVRLPI